MIRSIAGGTVARGLALGLLALLPGLYAPQSFATFATDCSGCHAMDGGRVNAANAVAVITAADGINGMGTTLTQRINAAAEIGGLVQQSQAGSINYGEANKVFTVNNLVFGGVINQLAQVSGPAVTITPAAPSFSYSHPGGAGGNCTTQNVVVRGEGLANTSNRTVQISINAPAVPTAANATTTVAYNSAVGQPIDLGGIGALSGTVRATGTTPNLGAPSPAVGTVNGTGPDTLTYTANATTYASSVAVTYAVTGPCSTTSATRTLTINVNAPPAPAVANAGPFTVPSATATANVTTLASTGVVQSNPAGIYNFAIASQPPAGQGTITLSGTNNSTVTYNPSGTFTGTTTFTYTRTGPGGTSTAATVTLDVTAAPIVSTTSVTTAFNTAVGVDVTALIAGGFTTVSGQNPVNGTVMTAGSTVTFTPTAGFFGTASFEYTATGVGGTSTPATVTVTVNPPVPTAGAGTAMAAYQTATAINLAAFISPAATVTSVTPSGATNGTATATGPTTVTFTPAAGYVGAASFNYTATNIAGTSTAGAVAVTVNPPGPPVAAVAAATTGVNTAVAINLGSVVTGTFSSIAVASLPTNGLVSVNGLVVTYTPSAGFEGNDSFTYTATGIGGTSAPATVFITVLAAPSIATLNITTPFNTPVQINVSAAITGTATSFAVSSLPSHGTLNGGETGVVTYTPTNGYFGPDAFVVVAKGPGGFSAPVTISLAVTPPPPAPLPGGLNVTIGFGGVATINLGAVVSSVATSFKLVQAPENGTLVINGTTATYTPRPGFSGPDAFIVIPSGPGGTGEPATVTIVVGTQIPVARAAVMRGGLNQPLTLDVASSLSGSGITGVNVATPPAHGTVGVAGTKLTYTPKTDFFGADAFTYVAYGNAGTSAPATISITVEGRPDPTRDATVMGAATAQGQATQRFAQAQQFNLQRRLEALRGDLAVETPATEDAPVQTSLRPRANDTVAQANIRNRATGVADAFDPFAPLQSGNEAAGAAPGLGVKSPSAATGLPPSLVSALVGLATNRGLDLASLNTATGAAPGKDSGLSLWVAGNVSFGRRDATGDASGLKFTTDGVSLGVDRRFGKRWVAGLGLGYGRDDTDIGTDGSRLKARGSSVAGYASYQMGGRTFIDGLFGVGKVDLDTRRYVTSQDAFATSKRKADQVFGSIGASYDWHRDALLISPYGRLDFSRDKLKLATESGAGLSSLNFLGQTQRSTQFALGVRLEIQHPTNFGWVKPRARIEYRHEFESDRDVTVAYADQYPTGARYSLTSAGRSKDQLAIGIGADFHYRSGLKLGIDYQALRIKGPESSQGLRILLVKDLDAKGIPDNAVAWRTGKDAIRIETGYAWDDNVTRARDAASKLSDSIFNLGLGYGRLFSLGTNSRVAASVSFGGEKFRDYPKLGNANFGAQGEYQFRSSGAFDATTFGIFARLSFDEFESGLRDGHRYVFGINARRTLTDRIDVFTELAGTVRHARSAVFDRRDVSLRGNIDYALTKKGTLYVTGEFRRGDTVSTGLPSLENLDIAEVLVQDDAYDGRYFSYRTDAKTIIGTLGYNLSLGSRDSIDFSWRRAEAKPTASPGFQIPGAFKYVTHQYSIVYLTRF